MLLEDGQRGSAIALPFDRFDAVDLPFNDALAPRILQRPDHRSLITSKALDKAKQLRQASLLGFRQPGV